MPLFILKKMNKFINYVNVSIIFEDILEDFLKFNLNHSNLLLSLSPFKIHNPGKNLHLNKSQMLNPHILKGRDIVVVGQEPWDIDTGSNCKNIAKEFSRENRVLYINSPLDRITLHRHKADPKVIKRKNIIKGNENGLVQISEKLYNLYPDRINESINWIKNKTIFNFLNKINNKRFAKSIKKTIRLLGFTNIILFNDNDIFRCFYLKELIKPTLSIYYCRDYMTGVDYWKKHGENLEPKLIAKSDFCVANSIYLSDYCKKHNPLSFYIGQGCDLEIFNERAVQLIPPDIAAIPKPIIGYVGALNGLRLNIDIIESIALSNPAWNIVLVGPEDGLFSKSKLHQINNIHFLGIKEIAALPGYINQFNVCINPQIINEITIGNYPRKIDEYLAMGKPVVATKTEGMAIFNDHCYIASTVTDFIKMIELALTEDNHKLKQERIKFAATHTWENSVGEIFAIINKKMIAPL